MNNRSFPVCPTRTLYFLGVFACLGLMSSQCPPPPEGPADPTEFEAIDFDATRLVLDLHASPDELYAITGDAFYRFDSSYNVVADIPLDASQGDIGIPALSDNVYSRVKLDASGQEILEFLLPRSPTAVRRFQLADLATAADNALLMYRTARSIGAFGRDEEQFVLPVRVLAQPANYTAFLFFEIRQNPTLSDFLSVEYTDRVDVPDLAANDNTVTSIRYFDDAYFVATEEGAFRITTDGEARRLFFQRMTDFFKLNGTLYATGFNDADLHRSFDRGRTWERLGNDVQSGLKHVEPEGRYLFTQRVRGFAYQVGDPDDNDLERVLDIQYPADFPLTSFDKFYGVAFFNGRYHFSVDDAIYYTESLELD